jgi:hypothetical protein
MPKAKTQNKLFVINTIYGQGVIDNGAKWGSYVTRNPDGTIPFDERMYLENPTKWQAMMDERMQWLTEKTSSTLTNNGCLSNK